VEPVIEPVPMLAADEPLAFPAEGRARVTIVEHRPTIREALGDAWHNRHLLRGLAANVVMLSFRKTILGPGWILIQALMDTIGKAFIFGSLVQVKGPDNIPYLVFLLGGMLGWRVFQRTLYITTRAFDRFSRLTRDLDFPLLLVPIASTAQLAFEFAVYTGLLIVALAYYSLRDGHLFLNTGPELFFAPLGLLWALVFAWGLAMFTGPLNSRARDVRHVLRNVVPLWLYLTPVIYPLDRLHGAVRVLAQLNPMAPIVEMIKVGILGAGVVDPKAAAWSLLITTSVFLSGVWFVSRHGARIAGISRGRDSFFDEEEDEL
jgi:ABC-type polysaccharide/polyol phosphate export permease